MVERARLLGSEGKGLGQQTGGNASTDNQEAFRIIEMLAPVMADKRDEVCEVLGYHTKFVENMIIRSAFGAAGMCVTGKQLFLLRDCKDKLIDAGLI